MTKEELSTLEWAIDKLRPLHEDSEEFATLVELRWDSMLKELSWRHDLSSLIAFMRKWNITIPFKEFGQWRMVPAQDQRQGEIEGLPESRGILRCTNGILCYIEKASGFPYLGHLQWFRPDRFVSDGTMLVGRGAKQDAKKREIEALFA